MAFEKPKHGTSLYKWCQDIIRGEADVPDRVKKRIGPDKTYKDAKDFAEKLLAEWDYDANAKANDVNQNHPRTPKEVAFGSNKKVHWQCSDNNCGYKWEAAVKNRSRGNGCGVCAGRIIQVGKNDLASKRPDLAAEWDYDANAKANDVNQNHPRTPQEVTAGSDKEVWWKRECLEGQDPHRWEATVAHRSAGSGCSVCHGKTVQVGENDLATERPDLAAEWDYKANAEANKKDTKHPRTPEEVTRSSNKKVHWQCDDCGHKWTAKVADKNRSRGNGCGVCAGQVVQAGKNDLTTKRPDLAAEWDYEANEEANDVNPKHPRTPEEVTRSSGKKVHWQCNDCGNKWKATVTDRSAGRGCPSCAKHGFDNSELAWLYFIESIPGGLLPILCIKFGISNVGCVAARLGKHSAIFKSLEGVGIFGEGKAIAKIESLLKKDEGKLVKELGYRLWKETEEFANAEEGRDFDGYCETLIDKRVAENSTASLKDLLKEILKEVLKQPEMKAIMKACGLKKEDLKVVDLTPETIKEYRDKHQAAEAAKDSDPGLAEAA